MTSAPVKVLVTGDVVVDHHVYEGQRRDNRSLLREGTRLTRTGGGARLIYDLLAACQAELPAARERQRQLAIGQAKGIAAREQQTLTDEEVGSIGDQLQMPFLDLCVATDDWRPRMGRPDYEALTAIHSCGLYRPALAGPPAPGCDDCEQVKPGKVWRLREALGYSQRTEPGRCVDELRDDEAANAATIWVLDDAGLGFRHRNSKQAWPPLLRGDAAQAPDWVVLKASAPLASGDLWQTLVAPGPRNPAPAGKTVPASGSLAERLVVVVAADDIRCNCVAVGRSTSWELAALDMSQALRSNPSLLPLGQCRFLVVLFGVEGALLADFRDRQRPAFHIVFHPRYVEGERLGRIDGDVFGKLSCFTAGIVAYLPPQAPGSLPPADELARLLAGARAGLSATQCLVDHGHGPVASDDQPGPPWAAVARELLQPTTNFECVAIPEPDEKVAGPRHSTRKVWRILEGTSSPHPASRTGRTLGQARLVARFGLNKLSQVPFLSMGSLQSVDREEIESLRTITTLMEQYQRNTRPKRPLSIGVFGQPGAGKSFGVKQIARAVFGPRVPLLEFNLSQLSVTDDSVLIGAFHQIRDKVLEGHTPVVFWDEFDAGGLQWLARLLAPMQDGTFLEQQTQRPIGKCIFVFAGGTSFDYETFGPPDLTEAMLHDLSPADRKRYDDEHRYFRERKGPDFKSRLTAYLNVAGPNTRRIRNWERQIYDVDRSDTGFPLRRALMLRGQFGVKANDVFDIDGSLLTALLQVPFYRYGARSMEKLVELILSRSRGGPVRLSHLPSDQLLDLHVDAAEFRRLLERDYVFQRLADKIAPFVHLHFLNDAQKAGRPVQADAQREFDQLPVDLQQDNVALARRMPEVLAMAGLELVEAPAGAAPTADDEAEVRKRIEDQIELLAEAEHVGWMDFKLQNDWTYAPIRDDLKKQHDCLIPYAKLSEIEKQKDRDQVAHYPDFARTANFRIKVIRG